MKTLDIFRRAFIIGGIALRILIPIQEARAEVQAQIPTTTARCIDEHGQAFALKPVGRMIWDWQPDPKSPSLGVLSLRGVFDLEIPSRWKLVSAKGIHAKLIGSKIDKRPNPAVANLRLWIDQEANSGSIDLRFEDHGSFAERSVVLSTQTQQPYILNHRACEDYRLMPSIGKWADGRDFFMIFSCEVKAQKLLFHVTRSAASQWDPANRAMPRDAADPHLVIEVPVPAKGKLTPMTKVAEVLTLDSYSRKSSYDIVYLPQEKPKRWSIFLGLGMTGLTYAEALVGVNMYEFGLTAKVGGTFYIIPKMLSLDVSGFGTTVAFGMNPAGTADAHILGVNGRVGYTLPFNLKPVDFRVLAGWYYWAMLVPGDTYGVNPLTGPQIFLQAQGKGDRLWSTYFKWAFVSDSINFAQVSNSEFAVGASMGLNKSPTPFVITLDLARIQFANAENSMVMYSASVGVGKIF
ncbi:MAG: hypothetical protein ACXWPM_11930 [Bdellovibrionota bacterium]